MIDNADLDLSFIDSSSDDAEIVARLQHVAASLLCNSTRQISFAIDEHNGLVRVLTLISGSRSVNEGILSAALHLLLNLTANTVVADHILSEEKTTVISLVGLMETSHCILSSRCLVNLTSHSSPKSRQWVEQQGALNTAAKLLSDSTTLIGMRKILAGLLCNLTTPQTSVGARSILASQPRAIQALLDMLDKDCISGLYL